MKKLLFLGVVFGGLALTSCKKDYTCECKYDLLGEQVTQEIELNDVTKKEAEDGCTLSVPGVDTNIECNLK